jgi:Cu(I)/Ag(I) efflux system membrane fusion protein
MKLTPRKLILGALIVGFTIALVLPSSWIFKADENAENMNHGDLSTSWACPMFCVVMDEKPSDERCPVCGMELGPVSTASSLSGSERAMIGLEAVRLEKIKLEKVLVLYGEVDWDETRLSVVSARTSGWIETLSRKITWEEVEAGDVLYELYAPEIFEAQQELIAAKGAPDLLVAARQRLSLLGLDEREIDTIATHTKPTRTVAKRADRAGVIVKRQAIEGAFVKQGAEIFKIADLSRIWVQLEVFEPDLHWLSPNTKVDLKDVSLGTDSFEGRIVFADPVVDRMTRTARVRVEVGNRRRADGRWALLPGQRIEAKARIFVSPNGTPLAENADHEAVVALPRTSVLRTGKRSVVYVLYDEANKNDRYDINPEQLPGTVGYAMVEVRVGPLLQRTSDGPLEEFRPLFGVQPIKDPQAPKTLRAGMVVATKGAFLIDSQAQLSGKPSLLFPDGRPTPAATGHENH